MVMPRKGGQKFMKRKEEGSRKHSKIRITLTIIAFLLLLSGLGLLLFPPISNGYGKYVANGIADNFDNRVKNIQNIKKGKTTGDKLSDSMNDSGIDYKKVDIDALYRDSALYNEKIRENQFSLLTSEMVFKKPALYLSKYGIYDGVYGYVSIPSIDLKVPIYLGVQNNHMSYGAVHLTYTSLPIGDKKSKCVFAGHSGYIGRIFFDNIRQLNAGDTIKVVNYWGTINYTVTGHSVIKPNEGSDLFINNDSAGIVLVTCIGNGEGGFDRYLVFGERK